MEQQLEQIRDQQKASWNKSSAGWKKWDDVVMDFIKPVGDEMIRSLEPNETDLVLDVAAGTGEPGLTIAGLTKRGRVVITDLAEDMLSVARENAQTRGLTNIETRICDVSELPFPDNTFDAVSCRFGYMFFPDMHLAAKEMVRVLKPGGRLATAVWGVPEKNSWFTTIMGPVSEHLGIPPTPQGGPGMFRGAKDGLIAGLLSQAGLRNVSVKEVAGTMNCGTADVYWNLTTEVVGPVVSALATADSAVREVVKREVFTALNARFPNGDVRIGGIALVISGEK